MAKKVYLTESELRNIISKSVKEVLNEGKQDESILGLAALAGGSYLYGKAKQRGETPLKNAYRGIRNMINKKPYEPQVSTPQEMRNPENVKIFQVEAIKSGKYRDGDNIVIGKWGPKENEIYQRSSQDTQNNQPDVEF